MKSIPRDPKMCFNMLMRAGTCILFSFILASVAAGASPVTFHKDIEPLLQEHCQSCHRPGEAAPFSLLTYKDARPWAKSIREAVQTRKMPPWFADPAYGHFANDRSLKPDQIDAIRAWVDQGAPEGKLSEAPPARVFSEGWKIGKPDLVIELPVNFPVPATGIIDYTWFAADMKLSENKWIEKLEVRPGDRTVVHHALAFARPPQTDFLNDVQPGQFTSRPDNNKPPTGPPTTVGIFGIGNTFADGAEMIGDYVPNGDPFIAGPGQARLVRAGSHLLLQMHYTASGHATTDRTRVGIVFAKIPPIERVVNDAVVSRTFRIPPGAPNHEVIATVTFQHDTSISGFGPHMHLRGKAMRYELLRSGSDSAETLLYVPAYNFNWQVKYLPSQWVNVKKGDKLRVTAWYDNSPNNPNNPDPTKEVYWGDQSSSEMLFGFFDFLIPADMSPSLVTGGPAKRARPVAASVAER